MRVAQAGEYACGRRQINIREINLTPILCREEQPFQRSRHAQNRWICDKRGDHCRRGNRGRSRAAGCSGHSRTIPAQGSSPFAADARHRQAQPDQPGGVLRLLLGSSIARAEFDRPRVCRLILLQRMSHLMRQQEQRIGRVTEHTIAQEHISTQRYRARIYAAGKRCCRHPSVQPHRAEITGKATLQRAADRGGKRHAAACASQAYRSGQRRPAAVAGPVGSRGQGRERWIASRRRRHAWRNERGLARLGILFLVPLEFLLGVGLVQLWRGIGQERCRSLGLECIATQRSLIANHLVRRDHASLLAHRGRGILPPFRRQGLARVHQGHSTRNTLTIRSSAAADSPASATTKTVA